VETLPCNSCILLRLGAGFFPFSEGASLGLLPLSGMYSGAGLLLLPGGITPTFGGRKAAAGTSEAATDALPAWGSKPMGKGNLD